MSTVLATLALAMVPPRRWRARAQHARPRTPKHTGVMGLALAFAAAVIAVAPASAVASTPEFEFAKYPVKVKGASTQIAGFEVTGAVVACRHATYATGEQNAENPSKNSPTLVLHPLYAECNVTSGSTSIGKPKSELCNFRFHAAVPGTKEGTADVVCQTGQEIKFQAEDGLCTISIPPQTGIKSLEYKNEPEAGTERQKVTTRAELSGIHWKATAGCANVPQEGSTGVYREAMIETGGSETASMAPEGNPAALILEAVEQSDAMEVVGINEPHWYDNHSPLGKQSGGPGEEGEEALLWGKLVLTDAGSGIGTAECQTEWGGHVYNPGGGGPPPGVNTAGPGEAKIDGFRAYDCTSTVCEATDNSKLSVEPEGLGVAVEGGVAKRLQWEGRLHSGSPIRLELGNKTPGSPTQLKWHVVCAKTSGGEYNKKWKGELAPELENGTTIGSGPSILTFSSGELEVEALTEGKVTNKLKMMGYEGGEIISTKNP